MIQRALLLGMLLAAAPTHALAGEGESQVEGRTVIVQVEGLACPFCVYGLERQFGRLQGVESAAVYLGEGKAILRLKPGAKLTEAQIREAVRKAGFKASEIKGIEERSAGQTRSFNGTIERSGEQFSLVVADGTKYLLFDQKSSDTEHALKKSTRKILERFADEKARVRVHGEMHQHKGMPEGLKVERVEKAP